jgi:hypothetical protein
MWSRRGQSTQKFGAESAWAVALFATWFLYLTIVASEHLWYYVGVYIGAPYFYDLGRILAVADDCKNLRYDVFGPNPCDAMQRLVAMPGTWLWLGKMGLGRPDVLWLGAGIDIAFAMLAVRLINPKDFWEFIVGTLVVLSPDVTTAVQKCNVDLIIFCLLSCTALLVSNRKRFPYYLGIITSFVATLLKIYPVITMLTAALMADSRRRLMTATVISSLLIISWLLFSAGELRVLFHTIPRPEGPYASGGTLLFKYLGIQWYTFSLFLSLGLALIALTIAIRLAMELDVKATVVHAHRALVSHYYLGLSVMSFAFLTNTNWDHRWIFSIFCLPWLFLLKRNSGSSGGIRRMVVVCVALMIVFTWSEALISDVRYVLSKPYDLFWEPATLLERWMAAAKQLSAWSLLTLLAAIGIKTFMIEGTYVSAMSARFVGRMFGQVASGFKSSDVPSNNDVGILQ